jgi:enoyl-CoA hydratase
MSLIEYERRGAVAVVALNRPERANAQNEELLLELDAAFTRAVEDDEVRVIVLRGNGKHFSAGHDLSGDANSERARKMTEDVPQNGLLRMYRYEADRFLGLCRKWRDLPKPTIAAVHGACIGAGLMLAWPCDLIVAADDSRFSDPVVRMGIGGVEYHGHTWEFGARKAKELLFTAGFIDAHEAHRLGMVNRVVPREALERETLALAEQIALMHPHALLMAKQAVNQTLDAMGQYNAMQAVFTLHSLGHANAWAARGWPVMAGLDEMVRANKDAESRSS